VRPRNVLELACASGRLACDLQDLPGLAGRYDAGRAPGVGDQHGPATLRRDQYLDDAAVAGKPERLRRLLVGLLEAVEDLVAVAAQLRRGVRRLARNRATQQGERRETERTDPPRRGALRPVGVALVSSDTVQIDIVDLLGWWPAGADQRREAATIEFNRVANQAE
jgi:hypothetical protein